jgi:hypothetical protein
LAAGGKAELSKENGMEAGETSAAASDVDVVLAGAASTSRTALRRAAGESAKLRGSADARATAFGNGAAGAVNAPDAAGGVAVDFFAALRFAGLGCAGIWSCTGMCS